MSLNQFERTKRLRKNWRIVAAYHAQQFSYRAMAAIFQVSIPTIYKLLKEHGLIRKSLAVPVITEGTEVGVCI